VEWTVEKVSFLAHKWDERVRRETSRFDRLAPEIEERGTVLREPASEEQIAAAEARLGVALPLSYRAFLLVSNGAHASFLGTETLNAAGKPTRHGFLPVEEVMPAAETDAATVELWTEADGLNDAENDRPPTGRMPTTVGNYQPLKRGLLLSTPLDTYREVLVPREGAEEWEVWDMGFEGAGAHRSFGDFLRFQVERPHWMPEPERADEYAAAVGRGQLGYLDSLAEVGDPRAGSLAAEWLESDQLQTEWERVGPARVLSKLADPETIPAMLRAYRRASVHNDNYRIALIAGLDAAGAPEAAELIRAAAEDNNEQVRRWARFKLGEPDEPAPPT
jgi:SMI1 / KNR4 family (SUKH-1)